MIPHFNSLRDWLDFCRQDAVPMAAADWQDPEHVDEIQAAITELTRVLPRNEDGKQLANMWLAFLGSGWRLVSVVGKRMRKEDVP